MKTLATYRRACVVISLLGLFFYTPLFSQFILIKDINPGPENGLHTFNPFVVHNNVLVFVGNDADHGAELWKTNGTKGGTDRISDIRNGVEGSVSYDELISVGGRLYFIATDLVGAAGHGKELWAWDGAAPYLVEDINDGTRDSQIAETATLNGSLYFVVKNHLVYGYELWKANANNASLIFDHVPGADQAHGISGVTAFADALYFSAYNPDTQHYALYKSPGTVGGDHVLVHEEDGYDFSPDLHSNGIVDGALYFGGRDATGEQLWKLQSGIVTRVKVINDKGPSFIFGPYMNGYKGKLYFQADDGDHGKELWVSDPLSGGINMLKDIREGENGSNAIPNIVYNDELYFTAHDGFGPELWKTDGTESGTIKVTNITATPSALGPYRLVPFDDKLYFLGDDGLHGRELWVTEGTPESTKMIADFNPGLADGVWSIIPYDDKLFVAANNGILGIELYQYDQSMIACPTGKQFSLGEDKVITSAESVMLNGPEAMDAYLWSTGATTETVNIDGGDLGIGEHDVWLKATDSDGCTSSDTVHITVQSFACPEDPFTLGADMTISNMESLTLTGPADATNYEWSTGASTQTVEVDGALLGLGFHNIWLKATDINNCTGSDTVEITVVAVTGIDDGKRGDQIVVYPNPTRTHVFFTNPSVVAEVAITDISGRMLLARRCEVGWDGALPIDSFATGVLIVRALLTNGRHVFFSVIKQQK